MKFSTVQWAAAIAAATTLGILPVSAQQPPPPGPPPQGEQAGPGGGLGGPGGPRGPRGGRGGGRMMGGPQGGGIEALLGRAGERLGLTAEQRSKIEALAEEVRPTGRSLHEAVRKEQDDLRKLTQGDSVDEGAIRAQATKLATAEGELAVHQAKTFQQVRSILTPEQLAKFKEGPRFGPRDGRGRDGRGRGGEGRGRGRGPAGPAAPDQPADSAPPADNAPAAPAGDDEG